MADAMMTDEKTMTQRPQAANNDLPLAPATTAGGAAGKPATPSPVATAADSGNGELPVKRGRGRPRKSAAEKAATIALRKRLRQAKATPVRSAAAGATADRPASSSRPAANRRPQSRPARPQTAFPKVERTSTVNFDSNTLFPGLAAIPGTERFQAMFSQANATSQEAMSKSAKLAEELVGITRGNVEALVSSGRIAVAGAQAIGQEAVELGKQGLEEASAAVKGFAEAKSPTELMQRQSDYARAAFDRMVSNSSRMTESLVKFAGEAFEPLSTRASVNAERVNSIVA